MASHVDPHAHRRVDSLLVSRRATITDITCTCPRSPCGAERQANDYALVFVRSGVFVKHDMRTQRELAAQPAHVLFLNRGEIYRISHPSSRGDTCTVIAYPPDVVHALALEYAADGASGARRPFPSSHAVIAPATVLRLQRLRLRLRAAQTTLSPDAQAEVEAEAEAEAIDLLRTVLKTAWGQCRHNDPKPPRRRRSSRRRHEITETVKEALARYPAATTSLDDLATYVGVSPFYLARTFRREAGLPIHQYLLRLRLGTALNRMADSSLRLSAIALDTGFSSPSHFTSAFRKTFGVAPAKWRAMVRPTRRTPSASGFPRRQADPTCCGAGSERRCA